MKVEKNPCVEECAKVPVTTYRFYRRNTEGYLKTDDGLVFVTVTSVSVDFKKQLVTTVLTDKSGKEYLKTDTFSLYQSSKAYESDDSKKTDCYQTHELLRFVDDRLRECCCGVVDEEDGKQSCYIKVWIFEKGGAKEIPVVINSIACDTYAKWYLVDGNIPKNFWENRKDAYSFNEYQITDDDGEVFVEEGIQKRINLTPPQWVIIKQMAALFEKAKDAGIKFVWDRDYQGNVKAFNVSNVHEYGYDIEPFEGGDTIPFHEACLADTGISFYDFVSEQADCIALNPTARQKKAWLKEQPSNK